MADEITAVTGGGELRRRWQSEEFRVLLYFFLFLGTPLQFGWSNYPYILIIRTYILMYIFYLISGGSSGGAGAGRGSSPSYLRDLAPPKLPSPLSPPSPFPQI